MRPNRNGPAHRFGGEQGVDSGRRSTSTEPQLDCAAPGVGIIATVPERFGLSEPYGAMDGTSMASPAACGMLAVILARPSSYLALSRNLTRSAQARALLRAPSSSNRSASLAAPLPPSLAASLPAVARQSSSESRSPGAAIPDQAGPSE